MNSVSYANEPSERSADSRRERAAASVTSSGSPRWTRGRSGISASGPSSRCAAWWLRERALTDCCHGKIHGSGDLGNYLFLCCFLQKYAAAAFILMRCNNLATILVYTPLRHELQPTRHAVEGANPPSKGSPNGKRE